MLEISQNLYYDFTIFSQFWVSIYRTGACSTPAFLNPSEKCVETRTRKHAMEYAFLSVYLNDMGAVVSDLVCTPYLLPLEE